MRVMIKKSVADEICRYWGTCVHLKEVFPSAYEYIEDLVKRL